MTFSLLCGKNIAGLLQHFHHEKEGLEWQPWFFLAGQAESILVRLAKVTPRCSFWPRRPAASALKLSSVCVCLICLPVASVSQSITRLQHLLWEHLFVSPKHRVLRTSTI